ncbi:MAG: (d)CMP kinase [Bacteroidota bacterium]
MQNNPFIIAIDGYAACGKSSTAKAVAKELDFLYIDTGAMYRSVTWYFLEQKVAFGHDGDEVKAALAKIHLSFRRAAGANIPTIFLNGEPVEQHIRQPRVSGHVSQVAIHASVREAMVAHQRRMGKEESVVMDGRDIGTVVFPEAKRKKLNTPQMEIRAQRRLEEMKAKGIASSLEDVMANLTERDRIDTTRDHSPLRRAEDAIVLDTSYLKLEEQVRKVINLATDRINQIRSS